MPVDRHEYSTEVVTSVSGFDLLAGEWDNLVDASRASVFQSFVWQRTWWKYFGEHNVRAILNIVTVRKQGRLLLVAPFFIESRESLGIVRLRRLSLIGENTTDYLDVIGAKGCERECIALLASHIAQHSSLFDVVHLADMPGPSPHHLLLYEELEKLGFIGSHFVNEYCPQLILHTTWNATLDLFPSSKRAKARRIQRKIEARFKVELQVTSGQEQLGPDFSEFVELHQRKWTKSGHPGVFADDRTLKFHREIAEIAMQRTWLFLAFLLLDGKRVAAIYGFLYREKFYYYLSGTGIQEELEAFSLGSVLQLYTIMEMVRRKVSVYDFMRGTERYKYDFNATNAENWTIVAYCRRRRLNELKFKLAMLVNSFGRRLERERFLWKAVSSQQQVLSKATVAYVLDRVKTNFTDGGKKLKSPERSLTALE